MGWFEFLRAQEAGTHVALATATNDAERLDLAGLLDAAWSRLDAPAYVDRLFAERADRDPALALNLARARAALGRGAPANEALRALQAEGEPGWVRPWLASRLGTTQQAAALAVLGHLGLGRATEQVKALGRGNDPDALLAMARAGGHDAMVVHHARSMAEPAHERMIAAVARRGDTDAQTALLALLTRRIEGWKRAHQDALAAGVRLRRPPPLVEPEVLQALGHGGVEPAGPALLDLLHTPLVLEALEALEALRDARAISALLRYRDLLAGDAVRNAPYRLAVHNALAACGQPQEVTAARRVLADVFPQRYGWPRFGDLMDLHRRAGRALLRRGEAADLQQLRGWIRSPVVELRAVGIEAYDLLGQAVPPLHYFDAAAVSGLDTPGLLAAFDDPGAVYSHNVVAVLGERGELAALEAFARRVMERRPNYPARYADDLPLMARDLVRVLKGRARSLEQTSSTWLRQFVLGEKPVPARGARIAPIGSVRRIDGQPFSFGRQINGLAVHGDRLAVVGDRVAQIVDRRSGAVLAVLDTDLRLANDCAFSPDGTLLAVVGLGGAVLLFDARGNCRGELAGHAGAPYGIKRCAFSADGTLLVTAGDDRRLIAWEVETGTIRWSLVAATGAFETVCFDLDGNVVASLARSDRGGEDLLLTLDPEAGDGSSESLERSVWTLAFLPDGRRVLGGEAPELRCGSARFAQRRVVRALWAGEALWAADTTGRLARWTRGAATDLLEGDGSLWALAAAPDAIYAAGTRGEIHVFDPNGGAASREQATGHSAQVRAVVPGATHTFTAGWDGQALRWSAGRPGVLLWANEGRRIDDLDVEPGGEGLVCVTDGLVRLNAAGEVVRRWSEPATCVAWGPGGIAVGLDDGRVVLLDDGFEEKSEHRVVVSGVTAIAWTEAGVLAGGEDGLLSYVEGGAVRWTRFDHGHGVLGKGDPHRGIFGLAVHGAWFATGGTDDVVRVYRGLEEPELIARVLLPFGRFNRLAFAPDGGRLAISCGDGVWIFDVAAGEVVAQATRSEDLERGEPTAIAWEDDAQLLIGTEGGQLFRCEVGDG